MVYGPWGEAMQQTLIFLKVMEHYHLTKALNKQYGQFTKSIFGNPQYKSYFKNFFKLAYLHQKSCRKFLATFGLQYHRFRSRTIKNRDWLQWPDSYLLCPKQTCNLFLFITVLPIILFGPFIYENAATEVRIQA